MCKQQIDSPLAERSQEFKQAWQDELDLLTGILMMLENE